MAQALIALGANLGNPAQTLTAALTDLAQLPNTRVECSSRHYETAPIGGPPHQPPFLNAAAVLTTSLAAEALLAELHALEVLAGRQRLVRWGARSLDLDLLLYEDLVCDQPALQLPHPRLSFRRFVLNPAAEIAGDWVDPLSGWTLARLRSHLDSAATGVAIVGNEASHVVGLTRFVKRTTAVPVIAPLSFDSRWSQADLADVRPKLLVVQRIAASDNRMPWLDRVRRADVGPVLWLPMTSIEQQRDEIAAAWAAML